MKQLNYLLVVLAATLYLGCTPPERVDNDGNNSDDIENNGGSENNGGGGNDGNGNNGGAENTSKPTTSAPYEVGDYYNESGKEGIVIEVDQDGNNGKIISLRQSSSPLQWASDVAEQNRLVGTIYMSGGVENLAKIVKIPNWKEKYPAFKWCFDYGKGWYLPALQEVESFSTHRDVINSALSAAGGTPIGGYAYWSSTEDSASAENGEYKAHYVNVNTKTSLSNQKKYKFYVRAVASFGDWYDEIYNDIYQEIYDNPNDDDNGGGSGGGDDDNNGDGDDDNNDGGGGNNPNDPITVINGIEMVVVHGGTFTMGSDDAEALDTERPAHSVTVSNYFIGKYEVTQALWVAVMGSNPSGFRGDDNLPVENISWNMAMEFITKLNDITGKRYRMPTEAEWELAAREALLTQKYPYSGSYNVDEVAWYCDNAENMTHPVGQKKPNPRGIYDMSGNVFELCYDWFGMYSTAHQTNPIGPSSGTFRIMRGGSYVDNAFGCRIIYRNGLDSQDTRYINVGLRLAMSADSTGPDYNDRGDWLGPDFYNPINPNPDPDNPNPNPDDPDPDNPNPTPNPDNPNPDNPDDDTPGGGGGGVTTYYVGKLVTVNGVQGIVYQTSPCVKIVTVKETTAIWCEFIDYEKTGATDADDGAKNMAVLKALGLNKYPAAKWCADLGEGWYLPAKNELVDIYDKKEWINDILLSNGFDELGPKEGNSAGSVWSSTEYSSHYAYRMYFSNSFMGNYDKQYKCGVRAVRVMK